MTFIDTHAHLYLEEFQDDIREVIGRAVRSKVSKIILPNIDSGTVDNLHNLSELFPEHCVPLMGLHPTHINENFHEELNIILGQFEKFPYKGMGEIGIDLYWDKTNLKLQQTAFERQLHFAVINNLPVVIHARESFNEILEILRSDSFDQLKGIFHAFTGSINLAEAIVDRGFLLGIGGILTFKNSHLAEVVAAIDINHLVLETDSPYLAPVPYRGKRNESSYIPIIAEYLSKIKNMDLHEVAEITTGNAKRLFHL
jgi:TatD DNase family protein